MKTASIFKKRLTTGIAFFIVLMLLVSAHFIASHNIDKDINDARNEALEYLEQNKGSYYDERLILSDTSRKEAEALANKLGAELRMNPQGTYAVLTLKDGKSIKDIYNDEGYAAYIRRISPDIKVHLTELEAMLPTATPTASRPSTVFNDPEFENQTYLDYLNLKNAWAQSTGRGVTIAIIDTGIDTDNPDFIGRISERSYNAALDKRVIDYDMSIIEDTQGHGTAIAAIIAANANDGIGVAGIAPETELLVIKTDAPEDEEGTLSSGSVNLAIYYAIECDVDIINMSFGSTFPTNPFKDEIQLAKDSDIICVASAGNDATASITFPAADENVIGVGALADGSFELASYSNFGENVDFTAPGTAHTIQLYRDEETGEILYRYAKMQGTSFSAPMLVSAIALHMSSPRYDTYKDVREMLEISSFDIGELGADWY